MVLQCIIGINLHEHYSYKPSDRFVFRTGGGSFEQGAFVILFFVLIYF